MKGHFQKLFDYDRWANEVLLDKFEHQFPVNPRIYELFSHTLSATRLWLDRCLGIPPTVKIWGEERLPAQMRQDVVNNHAAWTGFLEELQPEDFERKISYQSSYGAFDTALVDILVQVTNHATHHRGNIMTMMKEEGFVLPNIDYIGFARMRDQ